MKRFYVYSLLLILIIFLNGCKESVEEVVVKKEIVCEFPYIKFKAGCCLDINENNICDDDEKEEVEEAEEIILIEREEDASFYDSYLSKSVFDISESPVPNDPFTIYFSTDLDKDNTILKVDFGDGSTLETSGNNFNVEHVYDEEGIYTLKIDAIGREIKYNFNVLTEEIKVKNRIDINIREDNILLIDDEPTFIFGLYGLGLPYKRCPLSVSDYAENNINFGPSQQWRTFDSSTSCIEIINALEEYEENNIFVMSEIIYLRFRNSDPEGLFFDSAIIDKISSCTKNSKSFIGYVASDEPVWSADTRPDYSMIKEAYDYVKEKDSGRLVWMNFAPAHPSDDINIYIDDVKRYSQAADIISVDYLGIPSYCTIGNKYCVFENPEISVFGDFVKLYSENITNNEKPVWMVLQFGPRRPHLLPGPNFKQTRFASYQSIINGATGLLYYHCDRESLNPDYNFLADLGKVASEIKELNSVLFSETINEETTDTEGIEFLEKLYNNEIYILAVNRKNEDITAQFFLSTQFNRIEVLFENREISQDGNTFTDNFEPFDVHIYKLVP